MKILCLLLILANVSLFLWEYREGGFSTGKPNPKQQPIPGVATINLANEVQKQPNIIVPDNNQAGQAPVLPNNTINAPQIPPVKAEQPKPVVKP